MAELPPDRWRSYRARIRARRLVAPVTLGEGELTFLVEGTEWLDDAKSRDRKKIGRAVEALLADSARRWRQKNGYA